MTTTTYAPNTDRLPPQPAGHAVSVGALLSIIEWLSGDECHALDEAGLVSGLGRRLQALGLPVDRLILH
ncbi:adenylate/guanylate cyclase domain-containing protein, partial [Rhizobium ruizarguesonis]